MSNTSQTEERAIRVFVSSTFRDMQAERDELVLKIFPQLRRLCEERGVTWGEIDLRWGITEDQSQRGEVLPICLEEIKRCRPYFIGLLGERYGWIPDAIPAEVLEHEPWIREHSDGPDKKSVTELEILHGVLNNPEMTDHAFFYFRDPKFIDRLSADQKQEDFISEDAQSRQKLNRLKDDIRQQHREGNPKYEPRENYPDAKSLGEQVLADFTALIDTLYPKGQEPSPLQRERMDHDAFAHSRAGVYIGRQEYFDRLDAHVASDVAPLVVLGESGSGKSALLANWFLDRFPLSTSDSQPSTPFALLHFIGASPNSANAIGLLRRIMLELKERFELPDDVPAQADKIREEFPNWLTNVATRGPIVLVLDALNQLEDVDAAPDLGWLPRVFPKNCRVIVSTLEGRSLTAIEQRGWLKSNPPLLVHLLDEPERRRLIHDFLKQYTRDLGSARTDLVARAPQTANPLYLRVLLNELRVFGLHEKLGDEINRYLEAKDPRELYRKVIARWEKTYSEGINLVRDTLSLIWAARRGLSETELLEVLGQPSHPLPRAIWSPLFLAMSDALVTRSGLLTFAHDFLRTATRETYLPNESQQQTIHQRLAGYFQQQSTWSNRKLDELPWQLASAQEWQVLRDALTEQGCFLRIEERSEYELLGYWLQLKPHFDLASSYTSAFARWSMGQSDTPELGDVANHLALFLKTAACYSAAEQLMRRTLEINVNSFGAEHPNVAINLNNLAHLAIATNRLTDAEHLMLRALTIGENALGAEHTVITQVRINLARIFTATNRQREAENLLRDSLTTLEFRLGGNHPDVAIALHDLAKAFWDSDRKSEAEQLMQRAIAITEGAFGRDHPRFGSLLGTVGEWLRQTNCLDKAEMFFREALENGERCFGTEHPVIAIRLNNLATIYEATGRLDDARNLLERSIQIQKVCLGDSHPDVAVSLNNLAYVVQASHRMADAQRCITQSLAILREFRKSTGYTHPKYYSTFMSMIGLRCVCLGGREVFWALCLMLFFVAMLIWNWYLKLTNSSG